MNQKQIIDAYCRIRTIDNTIPDEVLDFMKEAALEKIERTRPLTQEELMERQREAEEFMKRHPGIDDILPDINVEPSDLPPIPEGMTMIEFVFGSLKKSNED